MNTKRSGQARERVTRRTLLARGGAAAGAVVAASMAHPPVAGADTDDNMVLGNPNNADATTYLSASGEGVTGFSVTGGFGGAAIQGATDGSAAAIGIVGGHGSFTIQDVTAGVYGVAGAPGGLPGYGVIGESKSPGKAGVYGFNRKDAGIGVRAEGRTAVLAYGKGLHSIAVDAAVTTGTAIRATASPGETALDVDGIFHFTRAGKATVQGAPASPKSTVKVGGRVLTQKSKVLATIQGFVPGVWVTGVEVDPITDSFTIHLNKPVKKDVPVAWFIVD